jgi:hypothetical protein
MAPLPHMLEEVSVVMPLVTLEDTVPPTTDTSTFKKAEDSSGSFGRS